MIRLKIEKGYVTGIEGGKPADTLKEILRPHGKPALNIAEFGVGTNDAARLIGEILEDEKVMGTVHVALGNNKSMGGTIGVQSHLDGLIKKPSFSLDGREIMKDGDFLINLD
jgi:leucyl aminopeptidase (aminopeptidase T)